MKLALSRYSIKLFLTCYYFSNNITITYTITLNRDTLHNAHLVYFTGPFLKKKKYPESEKKGRKICVLQDIKVKKEEQSSSTQKQVLLHCSMTRR